MEYDYIEHPSASQNFILLHGFLENAPIIKEKILPLIPEKSNILIPNGCFPIPKKRAHGWELYFSWYFFDNKTNSFYVDYKFPSSVLEKLYHVVTKVNLPLTIIGYSQGGYLAPFVAERLMSCHKVVVLGASYKYDLLQKKDHYKIYGLHGKEDDKVDPRNASECFEKLEKAQKGKFELIPRVGHDLNPSFLSHISKLLK